MSFLVKPIFLRAEPVVCSRPGEVFRAPFRVQELKPSRLREAKTPPAFFVACRCVLCFRGLSKLWFSFWFYKIKSTKKGILKERTDQCCCFITGPDQKERKTKLGAARFGFGVGNVSASDR